MKLELMDMARELGIKLANSCEFIRMKEAQTAISKNEPVAKLLDELQHKQERLVRILGDNAENASEALELTNDIERLQGQLQENPLIAELASSQSEFSALVSAIDDEINACIGHTTSSCGGNCGSCGGCAH